MAVRKPLVNIAGQTQELPSGDTMDKASVGLPSVDDTSDLNKPISLAQAVAIALKADDAVTLSLKGAIPTASDLNTYTSTGIFVCPSNAYAAAGSNFPIAAAGKLTVVSYGPSTSPIFIWHRYERYQTGDAYHRSYSSGVWSTWYQEWDSRTLAKFVPSAALLFNQAAYSLTSGAAFVVPLDTVSFDDNSWWSSANPSRLTVPAGVTRVRVTGSASFNTAVGGDRFIYMIKNGATFPGRASQRIAPSGSIDYLNICSGVLVVTPGDYFEMIAQQTSGSALILRGDTGGNYTWLAIESVQKP